LTTSLLRAAQAVAVGLLAAAVLEGLGLAQDYQ
jgi:hypothetical protein